MKLLLLCALVAVSACGGSPTAPTPPPPPNIQGQWTGVYTVTNCSETGAAGGFCRNLGAGGSHAFTPQQSGGNVSGSVSFGGLSIPASGSVDSNGVVTLAGSGPVVVGATMNLTQWRGTVAGNTLSGALTFTIVTAVPVGSGTVSASFSLAR